MAHAMPAGRTAVTGHVDGARLAGQGVAAASAAGSKEEQQLA